MNMTLSFVVCAGSATTNLWRTRVTKRFKTDEERQRWIAAKREAAADSAMYANELRIHDISFVPPEAKVPYAVAEGE